MKDDYMFVNDLTQNTNYSCKCSNKHGNDQSYLFINIICKHCFYLYRY